MYQLSVMVARKNAEPLHRVYATHADRLVLERMIENADEGLAGFIHGLRTIHGTHCLYVPTVTPVTPQRR